MAVSMYQVSVPVFTRMLSNLIAILEKAESHCAQRKIDPAALIGFRFYPDMYPFSKQIQIATDAAKNGSAYLAGAEPPRSESVEQTFAELIERVKKTIDYVNGFSPEQIDGSEEREISIRRGETTLTYKGQEYLLNRVLPNFFFHITTAYDMLRHNGVELGKKDYLGNR
ncbi:DUF1993 domain-containing protein [Betaproteobacteria bacterium SCN2]|nr:DUF1993 domain-containing protein [Betaproteobacteria bacterium SCN2]